MVQVLVRGSRIFAARVDAEATVRETKECLTEVSGESSDAPLAPCLPVVLCRCSNC